MKEFTITEREDGIRLFKFLQRMMPDAGSGFLHKMLRKKNIKRNGERADGSELLRAGDTVRVYFSDETYAKLGGYTHPMEGAGKEEQSYLRAYEALAGIEIVYENDDCVIFYKPAGILSQKAGPEDLSLNEYLIGYLLVTKQLAVTDLVRFRPSVLNRLDRNTRGLVLGSKSLAGAKELSRMLRDRSLKKYYRAVVYGHLAEEQLLIGYLKKDAAANKVQVLDAPSSEGGFSRIETLITPLSTAEDRTTIEIELRTGKSHQIRAQLAHIGHPVLGDTKYGYMKFNRKHQSFTQELCAYKLVFPQDCAITALRGREIVLEHTCKFNRSVFK